MARRIPITSRTPTERGESRRVLVPLTVLGCHRFGLEPVRAGLGPPARVEAHPWHPERRLTSCETRTGAETERRSPRSLESGVGLSHSPDQSRRNERKRAGAVLIAPAPEADRIRGTR